MEGGTERVVEGPRTRSNVTDHPMDSRQAASCLWKSYLLEPELHNSSLRCLVSSSATGQCSNTRNAGSLLANDTLAAFWPFAQLSNASQSIGTAVPVGVDSCRG